MALQIEKNSRDNACELVIAGEVDLYSSPELRTAINKALDESASTIAVNLNEVPYMDSSGVATLVEGLRSASQGQKTFVLLAPSTAVMKVLQLSRLDSVFDIRDAL